MTSYAQLASVSRAIQSKDQFFILHIGHGAEGGCVREIHNGHPRRIAAEELLGSIGAIAKKHRVAYNTIACYSGDLIPENLSMNKNNPDINKNLCIATNSVVGAPGGGGLWEMLEQLAIREEGGSHSDKPEIVSMEQLYIDHAKDGLLSSAPIHALPGGAKFFVDPALSDPPEFIDVEARELVQTLGIVSSAGKYVPLWIGQKVKEVLPLADARPPTPDFGTRLEAYLSTFRRMSQDRKRAEKDLFRRGRDLQEIGLDSIEATKAAIRNDGILLTPEDMDRRSACRNFEFKLELTRSTKRRRTGGS